MLTFKKRYTISMVGKAVKIGDHITDGNGNPILVVGITSVEVEGDHFVIEGYGVPTEY